MTLAIDHVIYASADLDQANKKFEAMGFDSVHGGQHPAFGTANRIVPFDGVYLELMAIDDPDVAASNPLGRWLTQAVSAGDSFLAMCVRTSDLDQVAKRLSLSIVPGLREKPDGTQVSWRLAGLEMAIERGLPFFISWDATNAHPSREPISNEAQARGKIAWVRMHGDANEIRAWLGDELPLRFLEGPTGIDSVGVVVDGRESVIR